MMNFWKKHADRDETPVASTDHTVPGEDVNDSIAATEALYRLDWERTYMQNIERVWNAISSEEEITAWMKFPTKLELRVGGTIHIDFSAQGSLEGIVCSLEAPHLLTYTWGDSLVSWKLEGDERETRLRLSHIGVHPELAAGLGAGWHGFLNQLGEHLTGTPRSENYRVLKERYEEQIRP